VNPTHDVHLICSNAERDAIRRIDEGLRARGLVPWFFEKDRSPNWIEAEEASIKGNTPVCAVVLGPAGWGKNYSFDSHASPMTTNGPSSRERFSQRQVRELSNHRANNDMAVALGCNLLRSFGMTDVGTSGFGGLHNPHEHMNEVFYYDGNHSQPVAEACIPRFVDYVLTGNTEFPLAQRATKPKRVFLSRLTESTIVGLGVVAMMCGLLVGAIWLLSQLLSVVAPLTATWALVISATIVLVSVYLVSRYY
jgi:hypothetical protein